MLIEITDVSRTYQRGQELVKAVDGVTLTLENENLVAITGASGSGKSTLLHLIGGIDRPDAGSIKVDGEELSDKSDDEQSSYRRRKVGFIFQFFNLLPTLTAWENVAMPRVLDGSSIKVARQDACNLLEMVGLGNRIDHKPSELSGGQMQRVAIARSLIMNPGIVLADEPTGNLDSDSGASILALLRQIADTKDCSVLMVTHDQAIAAAADREIVMRDGKIVDNRVRAEAAEAVDAVEKLENSR
ncbi:ABC transporter ATP-binding protein [Mycobacterium intermedium]|uniref:ABC transporter ATP-binding protein n=1 Tax=Mycobacterium intermedium TaxID=28445 RepID=A0A1E3SLX9_MYCIE|nr:ABC transporter ATP-binding protein [Mycobacterium intermedium]MCV6964667.1 ABC transporter ATP-binding protein [Mycobacterium intermedium]ODR03150.1 ABC transporter ATP-binding protein [Mycobacterium intermedium]OPE50491.1 ABC transporter ATP-binding protein [Mycobacterium intermedium]ORB05570.1 ABC transporter ATP-binding protein [Mycobacterium intermedium]